VRCDRHNTGHDKDLPRRERVPVSRNTADEHSGCAVDGCDDGLLRQFLDCQNVFG
jgi:hypothetical protein